LNHLDLFSGIGGFAYAAQQVWGDEHNIVSFVEQDKYCQKVLNKHWPDVPIFDDIKEYKYGQINTNAEGSNVERQCKQQQEQGQYRGLGSETESASKEERGFTGTQAIDLLTGGFPCQPFSCAGKQLGKEDDRFLWHEMLRIIKESMPTWVIGENVSGIINMELDNCITELEGEGYETQTFIIPACAVDGKHRRDRVWIVAHSKCNKGSEDVSNGNRKRQQKQGQLKRSMCSEADKDRETSNVKSVSIGETWPVEPELGRVANGIPNGVDRLKGLGNAIVPQVVIPIMQCIKELSCNDS